MNRSAGQLREHELEDFQRAGRALVATGLVTERWPAPGLLPVIRRYEATLRAELAQLFGWVLRVDARVARVVRVPARPDARRGVQALDKGGSSRPFAPRDYALVCLVLAALEREGPQTTIRRLVAGVERAQTQAAALAVDFATVVDRRAFVTAVVWLGEVGVLDESADSDTFGFIADREADALYDVDHDLARRLLGPLPLQIDPHAGIGGLAAGHDPPPGDTARPAASVAEQRVARRLVEQPAVYYDELDPVEAQVMGEQRTVLAARLERLTGGQVEDRAEGLALIDADVTGRSRLGAALAWPGHGNVGNIAAAYLARLLDTARATTDTHDATPSSRDGVVVGCRVGQAAAGEAWDQVLTAYQDRLATRWAADHDRLRHAATAALADLGLIVVDPGGGLVVRPLAARFRFTGHPPAASTKDATT